jgi:preprotein translocase subunit SecE
MGKVKDEVSTSKPAKPSKGKPAGAPKGLFVQFLINLTRTEPFKPMQGWYARVYTAVGLGVIAAAGAWRVFQAAEDDPTFARFGFPALLAVLFGWLFARIGQFLVMSSNSRWVEALSDFPSAVLVRVVVAGGLGVIAAAGVWRALEATQDYPTYARFGFPALVAAGLGWLIFRIVHFPPFAEFLIATEAEMNKVSWTNKEDLIRFTSVVLTTVVIMALFLFLVDTLWTFLLRFIGVLQFSGGGSFGSTA